MMMALDSPLQVDNDDGGSLLSPSDSMTIDQDLESWSSDFCPSSCLSPPPLPPPSFSPSTSDSATLSPSASTSNYISDLAHSFDRHSLAPLSPPPITPSSAKKTFSPRRALAYRLSRHHHRRYVNRFASLVEGILLEERLPQQHQHQHQQHQQRFHNPADGPLLSADSARSSITSHPSHPFRPLEEEEEEDEDEDEEEEELSPDPWSSFPPLLPWDENSNFSCSHAMLQRRRPKWLRDSLLSTTTAMTTTTMAAAAGGRGCCGGWRVGNERLCGDPRLNGKALVKREIRLRVRKGAAGRGALLVR